MVHIRRRRQISWIQIFMVLLDVPPKLYICDGPLQFSGRVWSKDSLRGKSDLVASCVDTCETLSLSVFWLEDTSISSEGGKWYCSILFFIIPEDCGEQNTQKNSLAFFSPPLYKFVSRGWLEPNNISYFDRPCVRAFSPLPSLSLGTVLLGLLL